MADYKAGKRIVGTSAERTALNLSSPPQTSWKLLARGTGSGTTVDTGTFTAKDNLMILAHSVNGTQYMRYNNDTGSNYANRRNEEGGTDSAQTSQTAISFTRNAGEDMFIVGDLVNIAAQEKLGVYHQVSLNNAGAGNAPKRQEWGHKWTNTSNQITRVTMTSDSGNYSSDDEVVVLGMDNDEADSGTNFWQELVNSDASSGTHTATFTSKKYLWVEFYVENSGSIQPELILGSGGSIDTGNNYTSRGSINGASDWTRTSQDSIETEDNTGNPIYCQFFIVNDADYEKLAIGHYNYRYTAGASTASGSIEVVGKWANTSAQADILGFKDSGSGSFAASKLKIWGAD